MIRHFLAVTLVSVGLLLAASQAMAKVIPDDIGAIQILSSSHKDIGHIMHNRSITAIQYSVQFNGYRVECISIVSELPDGTNVRALHNKCTSFVDMGR